ncbi:MAG: efflux RND transporter periplasmic adaptor subunit [Candidatus Accumulibacter sp.]|jgi:Cu(I)/Ag(I) efflux system membrane fusion protein|nr:efflux RND transporter periplasmic adaptor subunit [Accumulibacter sp.]
MKLLKLPPVGSVVIVGIVGIVVAGISGYTGYLAGKGAHRNESASAEAPGTPRAGSRKILYYRNPMGLADTSPVPKKDPMGMDYIAVHEGDDDASEEKLPGQVSVGPEKIQKLGVRTEAVQKRVLKRRVRATGRVEADERRIHAVTPRFEAYIERLHVAITGEAVKKGQTLFEVYSPELVSAQREYAIALSGVRALGASETENDAARSGARLLAKASLERLRNWGIPEKEIRAIARSGKTRRTLSFDSPATGVVVEKMALPGMRFMPGETLYRIADLTSVWVVADIAEQDIGAVAVGGAALVRADAYPDKLFEGKVAYVYPTLDAATRTARARIELDNPDLVLKPAMFAQVELDSVSDDKVLALPASALIDSGTRQIAFVDRGEGRFSPRTIRTGRSDADFVEVLDGIGEGERVVVAANFLIDAESNLNAAILGLVAPKASSGAAEPRAAKIERAVHTATGKIDSIGPEEGVVSIEHTPVASLHWPAMTMDFTLAADVPRKWIEAGARVEFDFVERGAGEWVITAIRPLSGVPSAADRTGASSAAHAGY